MLSTWENDTAHSPQGRCSECQALGGLPAMLQQFAVAGLNDPVCYLFGSFLRNIHEGLGHFWPIILA
jgi:hypothetical protein